MQTCYDDALPLFAAIVADELGEQAPFENIFFRDASGRLTLVLMHPIDEKRRASVAAKAATLYPYVESAALALADPEEIPEAGLHEPDAGLFEWLDHERYVGFARVFERRIVAQDWLVTPQAAVKGSPPVVVFGSHKGGVGRSTALAVFATALAERNLNALVIDLDLEAPGVGDIFLAEENLPKYGALDYFVESGITDINPEFFDNLIASSHLCQGKGRIHVCPAIGSAGRKNPQNIIGKVSRAYLEGINEDSSFLVRTRALLEGLVNKNDYDVVLVDARAGMNEATAAAILGLGAEVLLFGVDTPQTFSGYRGLLSYLRRFAYMDFENGDWRDRIRVVHAKASADSTKQKDFRTKAFDLFASTIYDQEVGVDEDSFNFDYEDKTAPHYAWVILNDSNYYEFDPIGNPSQVADSIYGRTYGQFIDALLDTLGMRKDNVASIS